MFIKNSELSNNRYDTIVIGSGPAGTTVASRLADVGQTVLVVETGYATFDPVVQAQYTAMQSYGHYGSEHWAGHWTRTLGGTSLIWGGWCATLDDRDFNKWPINYDDLKPYYERAAAILERDPVILNYSRSSYDGFRFKPFSRFDSVVRFASKYANFYENNEKVHLLLGTTLSQVRTNEARNAITGVTLSVDNGPNVDLKLTTKQNLVLAAGGIGNAQLMLAPTGGSEVGAGNERDMAGRCLMEHPHYYGAGRVILGANTKLHVPSEAFGPYKHALIPDDSIYNEIGELAVTIEFEANSINEDDGTERFILSQLGQGATAYAVNVRAEMAPDMNNRVTLQHQEDPSGLKRVKAECVINGADMRAVTTCLQRLGGTLAAQNLGRLQISNEAIYHAARGGGHTMGTTRMGEDSNYSVVDADCRVHGYTNYHVAGSSVFPTGGASNPTLTIVALAARLADKLKATV